jgi:hypothetical protein
MLLAQFSVELADDQTQPEHTVNHINPCMASCSQQQHKKNPVCSIQVAQVGRTGASVLVQGMNAAVDTLYGDLNRLREYQITRDTSQNEYYGVRNKLRTAPDA